MRKNEGGTPGDFRKKLGQTARMGPHPRSWPSSPIPPTPFPLLPILGEGGRGRGTDDGLVEGGRGRGTDDGLVEGGRGRGIDDGLVEGEGGESRPHAVLRRSDVVHPMGWRRGRG